MSTELEAESVWTTIKRCDPSADHREEIALRNSKIVADLGSVELYNACAIAYVHDKDYAAPIADFTHVI